MTVETFFANFGHFADAPNGVQKLRELILQLAVQGKLVPQDPNDEPASVLLDKCKAENTRMVKENAIRKTKPLPSITDAEIPFTLPKRWIWARLGNLGVIFNGNSVNSTKKAQYSGVKEGLPFIATKDVGYGSLDIGYKNGITIPFDEPKFKVAHKNAVLICAEGGSAGRKIGLINQDIYFGNKLFANEVYTGVEPKYIFYLYQSPTFNAAFREKMTGIIGGISVQNFLSLPAPLPPTEEQKRIVAKVDQLMALCDELEARLAKQQQGRMRLNNAALEALLNASESDEFADHWQRICNNFDLLYDYPETIAKLRAAILQLAVQGKLVPQDPNDEPASVLLERIKVEKESLIKEGKARRPKFLSYRVASFECLPESWQKTRLGDLTSFGPQNGYSPKPVEYKTKTKSLTLSATTKGSFDPLCFKYVDEVIEEDSHLWLQEGDILIQRGNSLDYVGIGAVYLGGRHKFIYPDLMMKVRVFQSIHKGFAHMVINCQSSRKFFREKASGTSGSMPKVNQMVVNSLPFPLPPEAEQKRIVAKVDQLMTLCDELEAKLSQAQQHSEKLMEATVRQILGDKNSSSLQVSNPARKTIEPKPAPKVHAQRFPKAESAESHVAEPQAAYGGNIPQIILDYMAPGREYSRAEIITTAGVSIADWTWAIKQLKEQGKVRQIGERRGARYRRA